jgi:DNA relaxase NicK
MNSYGEILVGTSFNPSGDSDVSYVKNECAKLINLAETVVNDKLKEILSEYNEESEEDDLEYENRTSAAMLVYNTSVQKLLEAQMFLVKLITLSVK